MSAAISTPAALRDELDLQLALVDQRALVVLIEAPAALDAALAVLLDELRAAHGLPDGAVSSADPDPDTLRALNHDRDALMRRQRLIWLRARQPADVRTIRDNTPDLTAAVDLYARLVAPTGTREDWTACRQALAALMAAEHGHLTTFGLEKLRPVIPIDEGYCPLVDWPTGEHRILVMGGAGSGKTTALRHLAWTYATGAGDPLGIGDRVPLLVPADDYVDDMLAQRERPMPEFLVDWLRARDIPSAEALPAHLDEVLLLVDELGPFRPAVAARVLDAIDAERPSFAAVGTARTISNAFAPRLDSAWTPAGTWRAVRPRWPSPADARRLLTTHGFVPPAAVAEWSDEVAGRLAHADELRELAACPAGLATLAAVTPATATLPNSRPAAYRALVRRLLAVGGAPPPRVPGLDSVDWSLGLIGQVASRAVDFGGILPTSYLRRDVTGWVRRALWENSPAEQSTATDDIVQWFSESCGPMVLTHGSGHRFVDRSVADALAAEHLLALPSIDTFRFRLSSWATFNPLFLEALLFAAQGLGEQGDDRIRYLAARFTSQRWQPIEVLARPLLALAESEALADGGDVAVRLRVMVVEVGLATPVFGGRGPVIQQPWLRLVGRWLDSALARETRAGLERWLVDGVGDVAWPALTPEGDPLAAIADSAELTDHDLRALLGDIPPELGRLLHRAELPAEPLVGYLRARSEWWLRLLADWTAASYGAPVEGFTLPVPDWLREEAAASAAQ